MPCPFPFADLETEYIQMKRALYEKFFQYTLWIVLALFGMELVRAIVYRKIAGLILTGFLLISVYLFIQFITNLKKNQELVITCVILVFYSLGVFVNYHYDTGYFSNPLNSFYYAYNTAILERVIITRIPVSTYRIIFSVSTALIRTAIMPGSDHDLLFVQLSCLVYEIYLDIDNEKHDKKLFDSYFRSKQQLIKFKTLVEQDIPEGILILNSKFEDTLFMNNSLRQFSGIDHGSNIQNRLSQFYVRETLQNSDILNSEGNKISSISSQTLLAFLKDNFEPEQSHQTTKKISCHLTCLESQESSHQPLAPQQSQKDSRIFEVKLMDIMWDEQSAVVLIFHDVTQQDKILQLQVAADMNKDRILATVSHELRTPLNGILGMIQIMLKKAKDQELLGYLKICNNSANLLLGLVNSILDLNQIRANKLKLYLERVPLKDLLKEILCMFEFQCLQKNLFLKLSISPLVPKFLVTDKNRLSQIFVNLLGNALKFTSKGGITLAANLLPGDHSEHVEFRVEDTGLGIKDEDKKKLFQMFGKLDQDNEHINRQGIGLGLTISENLAKLLCGSEELGGIKVESRYGQGSTFSFLIKSNLNTSYNILSSTTNIHERMESYTNLSTENCDEAKSFLENKINNYKTLPLQNPMKSRFFSPLRTQIETIDATQNQISSPLIRKESQFIKPSKESESFLESLESRRKLKTIMIVDDNPFNITVATHLVQCHGYNIKSAFSGQAAIELIQNHDHIYEPLQLILMDCQMPIMDGYQTTLVLKEMMKQQKIPEIPIVALTANNSESHMKSCKKAGMCDYMTKPLTESILVKILKKYC